MILKNGSKPRQQSAPSDTFPPREWRSNPSTLTPRQRARPSPDPWHHSVARFRWPSPRGTRTSTRRTTTLATSRGVPSSATFSRRRLSRVSNEKSSRGPRSVQAPESVTSHPHDRGSSIAPNEACSDTVQSSTRAREVRSSHAPHSPRTRKGFRPPLVNNVARVFEIRELTSPSLPVLPLPFALSRRRLG